MKKFLSMLLAIAMVIGVVPYTAMAETGTVIDIVNGPGWDANANNTGVTVTPEITVVSGETPASYKYQWYIQNNTTPYDEYILPWETEASITVHSQLKNGWYLNVEVTPLDSAGNAIGASVKERYIATSPMKGKTGIPQITTEQATQYKNTPSEYLFEVDGVKLILLDILHNGQYYVMMENSVGARPFDTRGNGKAFDTTAQENIGYWLNNDFLSGDYLPESVKSNITNENWTTEGDHPNWGTSNKTYKVGLLSYSEYCAYIGRFGFWVSEYDAKNPRSWEAFWLRSLRNGDKAYASAKNGGKDDGTGILGTLGYYNETQSSGIFVRPTFRLSADFFEKVEVENAGAKVQEIVNQYAKTTTIEVINIPGYQADVNHNGMVVTPEIKVVSGPQPASYKYQWYAGDSGDSILPWETGASLTIHSQLPSGWLWFEATPLDAEGNVLGETVKVRYISAYPMKGRTDIPELTKAQSNQYKNTPAEYLFEVDGVKLILLDRLHNGQFYVMMENSVGKKAFDTRGNGKQFDPAAQENIAYWLNNDFLSGDYLPESVKENITEGNWTTEGDGNWGNSNRTHKVGLLSYSEYIGYLGRFGLWLSEYDSWPYSWEGFWLRTLRNNAHAFASAKNGGVDNDTGIMGKIYYFASNNTGTCHVRPTFRLSADFFKKVKVNVDTIGDNVKNTLMELCTAQELRSIYTVSELEKLDPAIAYSYSIKNMVVCDESDGSTTVSFDMIRYGEVVDNEYVFIAAYNKSELVAVKPISLEMEQGDTLPVSESLGVIEEGYDDVRIFCFDISVMRPASRVMTIADAKVYKDGVEFCEIVVPDTIYGVVGKEMNLYFENSVYCNDLKDYQIDVECVNGIQQQERWTYTPSNAESFTLTLNIYQNAIDLITSKDITVKVLASNQHSVMLDGANDLLKNAVSQRMTVVESNPDAIIVIVDNDETTEELAARIADLKTANPGVAIGIVPPIAPVALTEAKVAVIKDIVAMVNADSTLFLIPAGWNVDGVYSCDSEGIIEAGAQQAADVILAAVCDR